MIQGIGTDIIEIPRIREAIERHGERFLQRLFLPDEIGYCMGYQDPAPHFAVRFAAKEAVVKALGFGFGEEIGFHDIEIVKGLRGEPGVRFSEKAQMLVGDARCLITLSHCREYATATVILERG